MTNGDLYIKADDGITITNWVYDQDEDITIRSGRNLLLWVGDPSPSTGAANYVECQAMFQLYSTYYNPLSPPDGAIWYSTYRDKIMLHVDGNYYTLNMTQL